MSYVEVYHTNMYTKKVAFAPIFVTCGEREIRTPDTLTDIPPFQGGALGHYATSP